MLLGRWPGQLVQPRAGWGGGQSSPGPFLKASVSREEPAAHHGALWLSGLKDLD